MRHSITIAQAKRYIRENYGEERHNVSAVIKACRMVARQTGLDSHDLFLLLIENQPIDEAYTHSYGFHTANGRHLIDTIQSYYYQIDRGLSPDEILILS